jgi:hypothetical protein
MLRLCSVLLECVIFTVVADSTKGGDPSGARKLGKASMWLSIVGIIVAVIVAGIVLGVSFGERRSRYVSPSSCCRSNGYQYPYSGSYCYGGVVYSYSSSNCPYYYYSYGGYCYSSRYYMTASLCCHSNEYSYSDNSYCYWNRLISSYHIISRNVRDDFFCYINTRNVLFCNDAGVNGDMKHDIVLSRLELMGCLSTTLCLQDFVSI